MGRDQNDLVPELQILYSIFNKRMQDEGIDYILTCTLRTKKEQEDLYAQGRTKPGKKVTWTLKSKHIEGKAFDIAVKKDGKISWDGRDYLKPGMIGIEVGLEWGGSWSKPDNPHFQLKE